VISGHTAVRVFLFHYGSFALLTQMLAGEAESDLLAFAVGGICAAVAEGCCSFLVSFSLPFIFVIAFSAYIL